MVISLGDHLPAFVRPELELYPPEPGGLVGRQGRPLLDKLLLGSCQRPARGGQALRRQPIEAPGQMLGKGALVLGQKRPQALALYQALGFRVIQPYYEPPEDIRSHLVLMEAELDRGR